MRRMVLPSAIALAALSLMGRPESGTVAKSAAVPIRPEGSPVDALLEAHQRIRRAEREGNGEARRAAVRDFMASLNDPAAGDRAAALEIRSRILHASPPMSDPLLAHGIELMLKRLESTPTNKLLEE